MKTTQNKYDTLLQFKESKSNPAAIEAFSPIVLQEAIDQGYTNPLDHPLVKAYKEAAAVAGEILEIQDQEDKEIAAAAEMSTRTSQAASKRPEAQPPERSRNLRRIARAGMDLMDPPADVNYERPLVVDTRSGVVLTTDEANLSSNHTHR